MNRLCTCPQNLVHSMLYKIMPVPETVLLYNHDPANSHWTIIMHNSSSGQLDKLYDPHLRRNLGKTHALITKKHFFPLFHGFIFLLIQLWKVNFSYESPFFRKSFKYHSQSASCACKLREQSFFTGNMWAAPVTCTDRLWTPTCFRNICIVICSHLQRTLCNKCRHATHTHCYMSLWTLVSPISWHYPY